jgi:hypothetical protein
MPRISLVVAGLTASMLAPSVVPAEEPADRFAKEDAKVLEAVLKDYCDAENPIHATFLEVRKAGKSVVLNAVSASVVPELALEQGRLNSRLGPGPEFTVSKPIGDDLRRRNGAPGVKIEGLEPKEAAATVADLDEQLGDAAGPAEQSERFWNLYPESWGFVYAFLPGYSADGNSAVVVLVSGPSYHVRLDTYFLSKRDGAWRVDWRQGHSPP